MDGLVGRSVAPQLPEDGAVRGDYAAHDMFGLQDMYRALLRRRVLVLGVFGLIVLAGVLYAFLRPPVYEAAATLMMRPNEPNITSSEQARPREPDNGYVQSQVEILKSPSLARQLSVRQHMSLSQAMDAIDVRRRDGTYIVEIAARSQDPERAARLANDMMNVYFASREQARIEYAAETSDWLSGRLNELRSEVHLREQEVERYSAANGLLTVDGSMFAEQQLRDAEATVVAARADLAERQARQGQVTAMIDSGGSADTTAGALTSETMAQLRARQADVDRRLAEYSERYGDMHPQVVSARAERVDIGRQIEAESQRIAQNLGNEADIASARVTNLQGHLSSVRSQLVANNSKQVRLRELERNAQAARAVYENFLLRYHEVSDGAAGLGGDAQVVATAVAPTEPVSRSPLLIIMLAAALGVVGGALAGFLAEQFSTRLQTADDIERKLGMDVLTSIPELPAKEFANLVESEQHPPGYVVANPMSAFAEAMRLLRARIGHAQLKGGVKVVAVTSATARAGKSSIALSLARVTALAGRKAVILDCDLRRRSLNHLLCIEPRAGITEVLRGEVSWRQVTGRDEASGADVLPAAEADFSPEDLFDTEAMQKLIGELREVYDLIILDCAPILALADVRDLVSLADGAILVARRNQTEVLALQTAINELRAVNANLLGIAFNSAEPKAPGWLSYADPLYFSHARANDYVR